MNLIDVIKLAIAPLKYLLHKTNTRVDNVTRKLETVDKKIEGIPKQVQVDMAENDPFSVEYVKNRPCYVRDDGTVVPLLKEFIPASEISLSELQSDQNHQLTSKSEKNQWSDRRGARGTGTNADVFNTGLYDATTNNTASGSYSHAEGFATKATKHYAHAEGYRTEASGERSHAEGSETKASGYGSHSEGVSTQAMGIYSHAEGENTGAVANNSHAEGKFTNAYSPCQHVQGKYNIADNYSVYAHIVGNGESNKRSNAHTLDWNGLGWFAGGLKVGGTGQDDETAQTVIATTTPTTSDAGKIPVVQNDGTWGLMQISNAEEASF